MSDKLIIGVDGGGTKTVTHLARIDDGGNSVLIGKGLAGSSNVRSVGWDQGMGNLKSSILAAWSEAGIETAPANAAVLALAGSGQADMRERMLQWAKASNLANHIEIIHDARAVLLAGTSADWGVALVAGTGSVAFSRSKNGEQCVTGGWGYRFGDEGSGYWLGQTALRAITHAVDHRGPATRLQEAVLTRLQIEDPRAILSALSATGDERTAVASLATLVVQMAEGSDDIARAIVDEAATHLANLITSASKQCGLGSSFPLALGGGVLCGSKEVRDLLSKELTEEGIYPSSVEFCHEPVDGCLKMASALAQSE